MGHSLNPLHRMKILVAEDDADQAGMLKTFLEHLGQEVVCAENGDEAIHAFRETQPDLVLMDILLPGIDGFEATTRIKEMAGDAWVPVLFISAMQQRASVLAGLAAGGHDYITKPIDLDALEHKLRALIAAVEVNNRLMAAEGLLDMVFDPCENAAFGFTGDGVIVACNSGAGRLLGRDCRALRGLRVNALFVGQDLPKTQAEWLRLADGEARPIEARAADGGRIRFRMRLSSRPFRSRRVFLALLSRG